MMHDKKDTNDEYKKKHELFVEKLEPFLTEYQTPNSPSSQLVLAHWIPDSEGKDIVKTLKRCGMLWFSIINLSMAKNDNAFYEGRNQEFYTPYLYAMFLSIDDQMMEFVYQNKQLILESVENGIPCRLVKDTGTGGIDATVVFAASPFKSNSVTLYFNINPCSRAEEAELKQLKEESKKLKNNQSVQWRNLEQYIVHNSTQANERFYHILSYIPSKSSPGLIKIYNVGQGFCGYMRTKDKKRIFIDIGMDQRYFWKTHPLPAEEKEVIKHSYECINKAKPQVILLTHWDIDHLLGICLIDDPNFPQIWIAPSVVETNRHQMFLCRLLAYLCRNHYELIMIGEDFNNDNVWQNENFAIYKGNTGTTGRKDSNEKYNDQGLIFVIGNKVIFPGDCAYCAWPEDLKIPEHEYNFLIAAHHGGEAGISQCSPSSNKCENRVKNKMAIYSYGVNNTHHHPVQDHIQYLESLGYRTRHVKDYAAIFIGVNIDSKVPELKTTLSMVFECKSYKYFYYNFKESWIEIGKNVSEQRIINIMTNPITEPGFKRQIKKYRLNI